MNDRWVNPCEISALIMRASHSEPLHKPLRSSSFTCSRPQNAILKKVPQTDVVAKCGMEMHYVDADDQTEALLIFSSNDIGICKEFKKISLELMKLENIV